MRYVFVCYKMESLYWCVLLTFLCTDCFSVLERPVLRVRNSTGFAGVFCHLQLQVAWELLHSLQPDFGISSVVVAAVITFSNICFET